MKIGTTDVKKVYLGNTEIPTIYLGEIKIYSAANLPYEVVGNPTITGSVVSNLSDSNYLIAEGCPKQSTMVIKITTGSDVTSWQYILSSDSLFDITLQNGYVYGYSFTKGQTYPICPVSVNDTYYIKCMVTIYGKSYKASLDGVDWSYGGFDTGDDAGDTTNDIYMGRHISVDGYYFKGSFDLSASYVQLADESYFIPPYNG